MFTYNLSDTEYLVFKTQQNHFELYSGHEAGGEPTKLAVFRGGKWVWDSYEQHKMFWHLYELFTDQFGRAVKAYNRSLKEKPKMYEFYCVRRKFSLKITRLKRNYTNWFFSLYPSR
jgi:hypothetical protein